MDVFWDTVVCLDISVLAFYRSCLFKARRCTGSTWFAGVPCKQLQTISRWRGRCGMVQVPTRWKASICLALIAATVAEMVRFTGAILSLCASTTYNHWFLACDAFIELIIALFTWCSSGMDIHCDHTVQCSEHPNTKACPSRLFPVPRELPPGTEMGYGCAS